MARSEGGLEEEPPERAKKPAWTDPERLLIVASALLLAANLLLILALFLNFVGSLGGWDAGTTIWVALGLDLVGAAALGRVFLATADRTAGRSRLYRKVAGSLLVGWVALSAFWRFVLPSAVGTNLQDLFVALLTSDEALPVSVVRSVGVVYQVLGLWIGSAAMFFAAQVVIALDARIASEDDWARGLPVYAWTLAAGVSFVATVFIAFSVVSVLRGGRVADAYPGWVLAKLVVAPNVFISGYASSLQLGRSAARALAPADAPEDA
ncbi:MAG TPA: hypothetical protein VF992_06325 [Thermoplasmata archaeon]